MKRRNISPCPLCSAKNRKILFPVETGFFKYFIVRCPQCELVQTFPLPSDEDLQLHDLSGYYGKAENKFVPIIQRIRDRFMNNRAKYYLSLLPATVHMPRILDIGCAEGRLLKSFLGNGCRCYGIEHKSYPESRFLCSDRISYFKGGLENVDLPEKSFDMIFIWHVLEHVDKPDFIINRASELLKENGLLVIAVPNFSSLEARAFKSNWFHLDIPWHKYHFTQRSVQYLIEKNNFQVLKSTTFCFEQGAYGMIQSLLNSIGWPRNELYESIKGNMSPNRICALIIQLFIGLLILFPCFIISLLTSLIGKGSVIVLVLKKYDKTFISS